MDKTEDAFEAGIEALEKKVEKKIEMDYLEETSSDGESDFDIYGQPIPGSSNRAQKRKHSDALNKMETEKQKVDYTCDVIYDYFIEEILQNVAEEIIFETVKQKSFEEEVAKKLNEIQSNIFIV